MSNSRLSLASFYEDDVSPFVLRTCILFCWGRGWYTRWLDSSCFLVLSASFRCFFLVLLKILSQGFSSFAVSFHRGGYTKWTVQMNWNWFKGTVARTPYQEYLIQIRQRWFSHKFRKLKWTIYNELISINSWEQKIILALLEPKIESVLCCVEHCWLNFFVEYLRNFESKFEKWRATWFRSWKEPET
jgi:hypothetical protein